MRSASNSRSRHDSHLQPHAHHHGHPHTRSRDRSWGRDRDVNLERRREHHGHYEKPPLLQPESDPWTEQEEERLIQIVREKGIKHWIRADLVAELTAKFRRSIVDIKSHLVKLRADGRVAPTEHDLDCQSHPWQKWEEDYLIDFVHRYQIDEFISKERVKEIKTALRRNLNEIKHHLFKLKRDGRIKSRHQQPPPVPVQPIATMGMQQGLNLASNGNPVHHHQGQSGTAFTGLHPERIQKVTAPPSTISANEKHTNIGNGNGNLSMPKFPGLLLGAPPPPPPKLEAVPAPQHQTQAAPVVNTTASTSTSTSSPSLLSDPHDPNNFAFSNLLTANINPYFQERQTPQIQMATKRDETINSGKPQDPRKHRKAKRRPKESQTEMANEPPMANAQSNAVIEDAQKMIDSKIQHKINEIGLGGHLQSNSNCVKGHTGDLQLESLDDLNHDAALIQGSDYSSAVPLSTNTNSTSSGSLLEGGAFDDDVVVNDGYLLQAAQTAKSENGHTRAATNGGYLDVDESGKGKETIISLTIAYKDELAKSLQMLANMRVPDDVLQQHKYVQLLQTQVDCLKRCNWELFQHQNVDTRIGNNHVHN